MVGGGVRGKDIGIAHGTTTQVGTTIKAIHLFIQEYTQAGEMTTGIVVGKGIDGTTNEYITNKLNETGETGEKISIGSKKRGVSKGCETERDHNNRLEGCSNKELKKEGKFNNNVRQFHNPERSDQSDHNKTGSQVNKFAGANNSAHNTRETMKEAKENNKIGKANNNNQSNKREAMKEGGEGSKKVGRQKVYPTL